MKVIACVKEKNIEIDNLMVADTYISRLVGLMFKRNLPWGGLIITPCSSIHTFFMRFEIDVVFIAKKGVIVKIIENMKPWHISFARRSLMALEFPGGSLKGKIAIGDHIYFK